VGQNLFHFSLTNEKGRVLSGKNLSKGRGVGCADCEEDLGENIRGNYQGIGKKTELVILYVTEAPIKGGAEKFMKGFHM